MNSNSRYNLKIIQFIKNRVQQKIEERVRDFIQKEKIIKRDRVSKKRETEMMSDHR